MVEQNKILPVLKVILIIVGIALILAGLVGVLLIIAMLQSPGGIGAEKLLAPILGILALGLYIAGGFCLRAAKRIHSRTPGQS